MELGPVFGSWPPPFFLGVSKQVRFYEIELSALRPTPSNPGGQVGRFLFFRSLTAKLPGTYGRPHKQLRDCQLSAMLPRIFCSRAVWGFKNYHGSSKPCSLNTECPADRCPKYRVSGWQVSKIQSVRLTGVQNIECPADRCPKYRVSGWQVSKIKNSYLVTDF